MLIDSVQRATQLLKVWIKKENQRAGRIISGFVEGKRKITVKENSTQFSLENSSLSYSGLREGIQRKKRRLVFVTSLIMSDRLVCQHKMGNSKHFKAYKQLINGCCKQSFTLRELGVKFLVVPMSIFIQYQNLSLPIPYLLLWQINQSS